MNDQFLAMLVDETMQPTNHSSSGFELRRHLSRWPVVCWEGTSHTAGLVRFMVEGQPWDIPNTLLGFPCPEQEPFFAVVSQTLGRKVDSLFYTTWVDGSPCLIFWEKEEAPMLQRELENLFNHVEAFAA